MCSGERRGVYTYVRTEAFVRYYYCVCVPDGREISKQIFIHLSIHSLPTHPRHESFTCTHQIQSLNSHDLYSLPPNKSSKQGRIPHPSLPPLLVWPSQNPMLCKRKTRRRRTRSHVYVTTSPSRPALTRRKPTPPHRAPMNSQNENPPKEIPSSILMPPSRQKCIVYPFPFHLCMYQSPIPSKPLENKDFVFFFFSPFQDSFHLCANTHTPPSPYLTLTSRFIFSQGGEDRTRRLTSQTTSRHHLQQRQQDKKGTTETSTRCQCPPQPPAERGSHTSPPPPKKPLRPAEDSPSFTMLSASPTCLRVVTSRRARGVLRCICL